MLNDTICMQAAVCDDSGRNLLQPSTAIAGAAQRAASIRAVGAGTNTIAPRKCAGKACVVEIAGFVSYACDWLACRLKKRTSLPQPRLGKRLGDACPEEDLEPARKFGPIEPANAANAVQRQFFVELLGDRFLCADKPLDVGSG